MKYIFIAGAPGSKWSSMCKNIYYSPSIDRSDYSNERTYYHDASGKMELMHLGAYFDPGMEFELPESMSTLTRKQAEELFDKPFSGTGVRIVKSHIFSYRNNIDYLKQHWPHCAVILVHREDDVCLEWWTQAGHFDITYPNYKNYYVDFPTMIQHIKRQNLGITSAINDYPTTPAHSNQHLAQILGIDSPPNSYQQDYNELGIRVVVL